MYHALLTNRYLTSRLIPLIAVAAVAMCVALVIIVVSIMTGFLDMVRSSGRTLIGDVIISYPLSGIPYYDRLIKRIEQLPEALAATPVVEGGGILQMPYPDGPDKQTELIQFWGIEPESFARVTGYRDTLHWKGEHITQELLDSLYRDVIEKQWREILKMLNQDQRLEFAKAVLAFGEPDFKPPPDETLRARLAAMPENEWGKYFRLAALQPELVRKSLTPDQLASLKQFDSRLDNPDAIFQEGLSLQHEGDDRTIVLGMHVSEGNQRQKDGTYRAGWDGRWWMPRHQVTLTTIPTRGGTLGADKAESRILKIVNEFVSGVFLIDDKRVMIPLRIAQEMTHLQAAERIDPDDPTRVLGQLPSRATMVLVRAKPNITPEQLRDAVEIAYREFVHEIQSDPLAQAVPPPYQFGVSIRTWAQQQAQFIDPVEKEREMMRTVFSAIYVVCAGLVLAIFWAIVYEKTRDIGILRSVGASRIGISWIFLRYGLVVGVLGAICGLGIAYVFVSNINGVHEALGNPPLGLVITLFALALAALGWTIARSFAGKLFPVALGGLITVGFGMLGALALGLYLIGGIIIWSPEVYYFTHIPNKVDFNSAYITMIGAVIFSLIGAFLPAAKAADTDPVKALRYE